MKENIVLLGWRCGLQKELISFNWDGIYKVMAFGIGLRISPTKSTSPGIFP